MLTNIEINKKLGYIYSREYTVFRIWSPTANSVSLSLYDDHLQIRRKIIEMNKDSLGVFEIKVEGDLHLKYYNYIIDEKYEITDPYSVASSLNSNKSCIVDLKRTNPKGFENHKIPKNKVNNAIIYEVHVKDYSIDESSNTKLNHRGKFLGLSDPNSKYKDYSTGIKNLVELGVTHVHLMPVYDFLTVDEEPDKFFVEENYNWGYDPELFNNIEGSYSTEPQNPISRIYELKKMILDLHKNNISVVMDVVYNHTYRSYDSNFNIAVPNYYYRLDSNGDFSNGSGCGNEFKSESPMGRKFIIDSLLYFAKEYKIDGFRFDLMALIDIDTINMAVEQLKKINPNILIYGEPWMALDSPLPLNKRTLAGTQKNCGFSLFNSDFRDAIKGDNDGNGKGYIQGDFYLKGRIEKGIAGSIIFDDERKGFAYLANESINYFNAHDNLILMDKLIKTVDDKENIEDIYKMAFNILLTSLGIPFFHSGNEFMRDKKMCNNSYNAPLEINGIDWSLKEKHNDIFEYVKELIEIRKSRKEFSLVKAEEIRKKMFFVSFLDDGLISYTIKTNEKNILFVIHNCNREPREITYKRMKEHISYCYNIDNIKNKVEIFNGKGKTKKILSSMNDRFSVGKIETKIYELEI